MKTTFTPFWQLELCIFCHAALVGSEIPTGACGHCARRFVAPADSTQQPRKAKRWGRRPFDRLRFYRVAK